MNGQPINTVDSTNSKIGIIVGSVIGGIAFLVVIGVIIWKVLQDKKNKNKDKQTIETS